ncbi:MAG: hypothetical protein OCC46_12515 [Pseudodesulfovibrio sp.]
MNKFRVSSLALLLTAFCLVPASTHAKQLVLRMPSYSDGAHLYFFDLLNSALKQNKSDVIIEGVDDFPHLREREMLTNGKLSALWLIRTDERDAKFIPVPVGLTNGLIGKRILLVAPQHINTYKDVKSLDDFRKLGHVGAFGIKWFDIAVWKANSLSYRAMANWRLIYAMLAEEDRGINYFSRGINEIAKEAELHPELSIEPHLMFTYERDYILYVSPKNSELASILGKALKQARDSGLMDKIIKKHWAKSFDIIKPDQRTLIKLRTPR